MLQSPLIDPRQLARLKKLGGNELIEKIIIAFLEFTPSKIEVLYGNPETRNLSAVQFSAHSLKSSAGNLGATKLQFWAQSLESACESENIEETNTIIPRILEAYKETCEALKIEQKGR